MWIRIRRRRIDDMGQDSSKDVKKEGMRVAEMNKERAVREK